MTRRDIIRAWKDQEHRLNLSDEEKSLLPENPAGAIELTEDDLDATVGGRRPQGSFVPLTTFRVCCRPLDTSKCGIYRTVKVRF